MVVGTEGETDVHYLMPLRNIGYDLREYERQARIVWRDFFRKGRRPTAAEFTSRFPMDGKLTPCITIVIYYGDDWNGSKSLKGLFNLKDVPSELASMVNDYPIYILDVKKLKDTSVFTSDMRQVFDFIRFSDDKEKLKKLIFDNPSFENVLGDAYDMMEHYGNARELIPIKEDYREGDGINMCKGSLVVKVVVSKT